MSRDTKFIMRRKRPDGPVLPFNVTDPDDDAPDGTLMTFERVGGRWEPRPAMTDEPGLRADRLLEPGPMREWFSDLIAGASLNTPPGWVHLTPVEVSRLHAWLARTPAASDGSLDRLAKALMEWEPSIKSIEHARADVQGILDLARLSESTSEGKTE